MGKNNFKIGLIIFQLGIIQFQIKIVIIESDCVYFNLILKLRLCRYEGRTQHWVKFFSLYFDFTDISNYLL